MFIRKVLACLVVSMVISRVSAQTSTEERRGCFKIISRDQMTSCMAAAKNALQNVPNLGPGTLTDTLSDGVDQTATHPIDGDKNSGPNTQ